MIKAFRLFMAKAFKRMEKKLSTVLPERLDRTIYVLFFTILFFTALKLLITLPFSVSLAIIIYRVLAFVLCLIAGVLLVRKPSRLYLYTKIGVLIMSGLVLSRVWFIPNQLNLEMILNIYISIMIAFYAVGRKWGVFLSVV